MARPTKNSCDYFTHDTEMRNHRKVKALRTKFGPTGYAVWSMFLEFLTGSDGNVFENSNIEKELLSGDFGVSFIEINDILNYCLQIELLFEEKGFIFSESLNKRLEPVYKKRGKAKELSEKQIRVNGKFVTETPTEPAITVTEKPQSKVKDIKVNKIKENNTLLSETSSGNPVNDSLILKEEVASTPLPVIAKPKKNKKEVPESERILRAECKNFFLLFYLSEFQEEYDWPVKDSVAMPDLLRKIRNKIKEKNEIEIVSDDKTLAGFKQIISGIKDEFVRKNFSLALINSKFNEIFIQLKTPNLNGPKPANLYDQSKYR